MHRARFLIFAIATTIVLLGGLLAINIDQPESFATSTPDVETTPTEFIISLDDFPTPPSQKQIQLGDIDDFVSPSPSTQHNESVHIAPKTIEFDLHVHHDHHTHHNHENHTPENHLIAQAANPGTHIDVKSEETNQIIANQVVVQFAPDSTEAERNAYLETFDATSNTDIHELNTVVITVDDDASLPETDIVTSYEADHVVSALVSPISNDALVAQQWSLEALNIAEQQEAAKNSNRSITVAVIDSGICSEHPDLVGKILAGYDFVDNDRNPQDEFGHGCAIAGIIAANHNNNIGITGIAPNTYIMPLRVLNNQGLGSYSDVAEAIIYAANNNADIINLSLGGSHNSAVLQDAVAYAHSKGVVLVGAAGNSGQPTTMYPAAYPQVWAIGALDTNLNRSGFSNYGSAIVAFAPGQDILTTTPGGSYQQMSGTSMAAPHIAGVVALYMGIGEAISPAQIQESLDIQLDTLVEEAPTAMTEMIVEYHTGLPEGDVIIMGDIAMPAEYAEVGALATYGANTWINGIVPYTFAANLKGVEKQAVRDAMSLWQDVSGLKFVPRTNQQDFIHFIRSTGNWSYIGRIGGKQDIGIVSWDSIHTIAHEIAHALGWYHEQSRPDRNQYIQVKWGRITEGYEHNFAVVPDAQTNKPYDFLSIMHYPAWAYSTNGQPTIVTREGYEQYQNRMGQTSYLSSRDKAGMAALYPAEPAATPTPKPTNTPTPIPTATPIPNTPTPTPTPIKVVEDIFVAGLPAGYYEETDIAFNFHGEWQNWETDDASNDALHYSYDPTASIHFRFEGVGFILYTLRSEEHGLVEICVDNKCHTQDFAEDSNQWRVPYEVTGYPYGTYDVVIRNASGNETLLDLDAVRILATGVPPAPDSIPPPIEDSEPSLTAGNYEETNQAFTYHGAWMDWEISDASDGNTRYTYEYDATVSFAFSGTGFTVYNIHGPSSGNLEVCTDDACTTLDLNQPTSQSQVPTVFDGFAPGQHEIVIRSLANDGKFVDIDKIQIHASETTAPTEEPTEEATPEPTPTLTPIATAIAASALEGGYVEGEDERIRYGGQWADYSLDILSGGQSQLSYNADDWAEFEFVGEAFTLWGFRTYSHGIMEVCIDGMCSDHDLAHDGEITRQGLPFDNLGSGVHTVRITNKTQDLFIDLDGVEVGNAPSNSPYGVQVADPNDLDDLFRLIEPATATPIRKELKIELDDETSEPTPTSTSEQKVIRIDLNDEAQPTPEAIMATPTVIIPVRIENEPTAITTEPEHQQPTATNTPAPVEQETEAQVPTSTPTVIAKVNEIEPTKQQPEVEKPIHSATPVCPLGTPAPTATPQGWVSDVATATPTVLPSGCPTLTPMPTQMVVETNEPPTPVPPTNTPIPPTPTLVPPTNTPIPPTPTLVPPTNTPVPPTPTLVPPTNTPVPPTPTLVPPTHTPIPPTPTLMPPIESSALEAEAANQGDKENIPNCAGAKNGKGKGSQNASTQGQENGSCHRESAGSLTDVGNN